MAKSNPIGVRFDDRILSKYPALSPQKILNKLTEKDLNDQIENSKNNSEKLKVEVEPVKVKGDIPPIPKREDFPPGMNGSIDFGVAKNEWKKKYNQ